MAEVGAQQLGVGGVGAQALDHPIRRGLTHQQAQGRTAAGQRLTQLAHEAIVDADIGEGAGSRTHARSYGSPKHGIEEQQAHEGAPEAAAEGAGCGEVDRLTQVHLALGVVLHHHRILQGDQLLALDVHQLAPHLLGLLSLGKPHHHKAAHPNQPQLQTG